MNGSRSLFPHLIPTALLVVWAGCHSDVAPVSGRVTLDGRPLSGAVVTFQPKAARSAAELEAMGSVGRTDDQGRYTLRLIHPDKAGAAVGDHSVTISAVKGGSDEAPATGQKLPKVWNDGSQRFKVPAGGTSDANFDIKSVPNAGK